MPSHQETINHQWEAFETFLYILENILHRHQDSVTYQAFKFQGIRDIGSFTSLDRDDIKAHLYIPSTMPLAYITDDEADYLFHARNFLKRKPKDQLYTDLTREQFLDHLACFNAYIPEPVQAPAGYDKPFSPLPIHLEDPMLNPTWGNSDGDDTELPEETHGSIGSIEQYNGTNPDPYPDLQPGRISPVARALNAQGSPGQYVNIFTDSEDDGAPISQVLMPLDEENRPTVEELFYNSDDDIAIHGPTYIRSPAVQPSPEESFLTADQWRPSDESSEIDVLHQDGESDSRMGRSTAFTHPATHPPDFSIPDDRSAFEATAAIGLLQISETGCSRTQPRVTGVTDSTVESPVDAPRMFEPARSHIQNPRDQPTTPTAATVHLFETPEHGEPPLRTPTKPHVQYSYPGGEDGCEVYLRLHSPSLRFLSIPQFEECAGRAFKPLSSSMEWLVQRFIKEHKIPTPDRLPRDSSEDRHSPGTAHAHPSKPTEPATATATPSVEAYTPAIDLQPLRVFAGDDINSTQACSDDLGEDQLLTEKDARIESYHNKKRAHTKAKAKAAAIKPIPAPTDTSQDSTAASSPSTPMPKPAKR